MSRAGAAAQMMMRRRAFASFGITGFGASDYLQQAVGDRADLSGDVTMLYVFQRTIELVGNQAHWAQASTFTAGSPGFLALGRRFHLSGLASSAGGPGGGDEQASDVGEIHFIGLIGDRTITDESQHLYDIGPGTYDAETGPYIDAVLPPRIGSWGGGAIPAVSVAYLGHVIVDGVMSVAELAAWWRACASANHVIAPVGQTLIERVDVSLVSGIVAGVGLCPASIPLIVGAGPFDLVGTLDVVDLTGVEWTLPAGSSSPLADAVVYNSGAFSVPTGTVKVMLAGDSLTAGFPDKNGPRQQIYDRLDAESVTFDFVGSIQPAGSTVTDNDCSAVAGDTVALLATRLASDIPTFDPHVVTIMIAWNDFTKRNLGGVWTQMLDLLDTLYTDAPNAIVLLGTQTISVPDHYQRCGDYWNDTLPRVVTDQVALGRECHHVDTMSAFGAGDLFDEVHPETVGYTALGDVWADAILEVISGGAFS